MQIDRIDHLVLTVANIQNTCNFYKRVLGMQVVTFDNGRKALQFGAQKINLHEWGNEFEPRALQPTPGSADLCFITEVPLEQVLEHMRSCMVEIVEGPVRKTGAMGQLHLYIYAIQMATYLKSQTTSAPEGSCRAEVEKG